MGVIIEQMKMFADLMQGKQRDFMMAKLENAKEVKISPMTEVFSKKEISYIKRFIRPEKKECYKNATRLCWAFPDKVLYCEGQFTCYGIPFDHAFNKVGDKYIDITSELVLGKFSEEYVTFGEWDAKTVAEVATKNEVYGDVFVTKYLEN